MEIVRTFITIKTYILVILITLYIFAINGAAEQDIFLFIKFMKVIMILCYLEVGILLINAVMYIFEIYKERKEAKKELSSN